MSVLALILIVLLVVILIGALPRWPYMAHYGWGYGPFGLVSILLIILIVLLLMGRI